MNDISFFNTLSHTHNDCSYKPRSYLLFVTKLCIQFDCLSDITAEDIEHWITGDTEMILADYPISVIRLQDDWLSLITKLSHNLI